MLTRRSLAVLLFPLLFGTFLNAGDNLAPLKFNQRSRVATKEGTFEIQNKEVLWQPKQTGHHRVRHVGCSPLSQCRAARRKKWCRS